MEAMKKTGFLKAIALFLGTATLIYAPVVLASGYPSVQSLTPDVSEYSDTYTETFELSPAPTSDQLLSSIQDFVETPKGGVPWEMFGETGQKEYSYLDTEEIEWTGVRPEFTEALKKLDGAEILVQGYMFPLGQEEDQELFLLGPFPLSCPFHYHVTPNLVIEVKAKMPIPFSYDPVNIRGTLELIPKDDELNVFYRLHHAELSS